MVQNAEAAIREAEQSVHTLYNRKPRSFFHPFFWIGQLYILGQILIAFLFAPQTPRTFMFPLPFDACLADIYG